jgi:hypothetical protein
LGFLVGSKAEQNLDVIHTQNATPDLNFVIHYRLINAPGAFNSQNTNHNNIRFNSDFSSKSKRYHAFLIIMSNALQSSENGGITDEKFLVNPNGAYNDRFNIPTNLASALYTTRNFFNVKLYTGNRYTDKQILLRQQYDFGKKDSIVTDSSVVKYFLPRIRFEHTIHQLNYNYKYVDIQADDAPTFYKNNYGLAGSDAMFDFSNPQELIKQFQKGNNNSQSFSFSFPKDAEIYGQTKSRIQIQQDGKKPLVIEDGKVIEGGDDYSAEELDKIKSENKIEKYSFSDDEGKSNEFDFRNQKGLDEFKKQMKKIKIQIEDEASENSKSEFDTAKEDMIKAKEEMIKAREELEKTKQELEKSKGKTKSNTA